CSIELRENQTASVSKARFQLGWSKTSPKRDLCGPKSSDYTSESTRWIRGEASHSAIWHSTTLNMNWSTTRSRSMRRHTRQCDPTNELFGTDCCRNGLTGLRLVSSR